MKKRVLISLLAVCLAFMCSCSDKDSSSGDSSKTDSSAASSSAAENSSESAADSSSSSAADSSKADSSSQAAPVYDYEHGTDGYYNLLDECKQFQLKTQQLGTCWLYAGRASMQTAYEKQTGKELKMEIYDMLEAIYGDNKQEGFFVKSGVDKGELGGWQWIITDTLSRGYKDGLTIDSSVIIDPTDREAIKNTLRTRGAVAIGVLDNQIYNGTFGKYYTVNYGSPDEFDHNVTIVGYDDHFPKEYFSTPASQDGAWIVYNSTTGTMLNYLSYDSKLNDAIAHTVAISIPKFSAMMQATKWTDISKQATPQRPQMCSAKKAGSQLSALSTTLTSRT